ncbi:MltA domain-containing protein [Dyella silvatica]|uniref:MltA domain-containing protein n=1 Tax=Dyella silvatica TaxID=2992128 RepID=UPI00225AED01|nr:MltA domain-containing protein [Dyella silvatica]
MSLRRRTYIQHAFSGGVRILLLCGSIAAYAQTVAPVASSSSAASPAAGDPGQFDLGQPFVTKYARFQPVPFDSIPGWRTDAVRESLAVFSRSCAVLARKDAWSTACTGLTPADGSSDDTARHFFEAHFQVYQVMNPDTSIDGRITGYYEPQLDGSSERNEHFRYPVYAQPHDLYELDARSLSGANRQAFRIEGNRLLAAAPGSSDAHDYELALQDSSAGVADKRYRVRIDGERIVPYYNRQQIESSGIDAEVIAWVDDAYALYSMQVQGSGKIRLQNGNLIRVAYAEQNGQPFLPNASASDSALADSAIKTRGLRLGAASAAGTAANTNDDVSAIIAQLKRSGDHPAGYPTQASAPTPVAAATGSAPRTAQVQSMIEQLGRHSGSPPTATVQAATAPLPVDTPAPRARDPQVQAMIAQLLGKAPASAADTSTPAPATHPTITMTGSEAARMAVDPGHKKTARSGVGASSGIGDPSYVFFRVIPDGPQGPLGALGVPLTAGRSLAVDPRTTPLGAPVFVTTAAPHGAGTIDRLMFAQDTGGAIRGSVRGDFFWGFGDDAGNMAAAMNANGRMWLLLPKGLTLGALNPRVRTRSLGSSAAAPDCVIPDDQSCVEN